MDVAEPCCLIKKRKKKISQKKQYQVFGEDNTMNEKAIPWSFFGTAHTTH